MQREGKDLANIGHEPTISADIEAYEREDEPEFYETAEERKK